MRSRAKHVRNFLLAMPLQLNHAHFGSFWQRKYLRYEPNNLFSTEDVLKHAKVTYGNSRVSFNASAWLKVYTFDHK